jgi:ABC-type branched-subunit amino acid transport system substrate-binding protein
MRWALALLAVPLAGVLALTGCSTTVQSSGTQQSGGGPGKTGNVTTDFGVTRSEITLGALTDYSGPFSELGLGVVQGSRIWVNETNAAGGVCGRQIKLAVRNHGYDTGQAKIQSSRAPPTTSR